MAHVSFDEFLSHFPRLTEELIAELQPLFEMPQYAVDYLRQLCEYNVPGGKLNRGLTVPHALQAIKGRELTEDERKDAIILGWGIEWLQAYFLVADDLMDSSQTRRGQPCWYKRQKPLEGSDGELIGVIASNDSFILESMIYRIFKKHFRARPFYADLLDLFHEVSYQTQLGQLLDLTSQPNSTKKDLDLFTEETYKRIVKYKTAFYSFYMPVALAMMLADLYNEQALNTARSILLPMGEYFQVQDDYLDCYGLPEQIGKIGRDIEENKCSWLVVQALKIASPEQRQILEENYAREEPECVARVKQLYKDLNIEQLFQSYENQSFEALKQLIESAEHVPKAAFEGLLAKIYKRKA